MYQLLHYCYRDAILQWLERLYNVDVDYVKQCLVRLRRERIVLRDVEIMLFAAIFQTSMECAPVDCELEVRVFAALRLTIAWGGKYDDVFTTGFLLELVEPRITDYYDVNAIDRLVTYLTGECSHMTLWDEAQANAYIREKRVFITVPNCRHAGDLASLFPADR